MHRKAFLEWADGATLQQWFRALIDGQPMDITGWSASFYMEDGLVVELVPDQDVNAFLLQTREWPAEPGSYRWRVEASRDADGESIVLADGLLDFRDDNV